MVWLQTKAGPGEYHGYLGIKKFPVCRGRVGLGTRARGREGQDHEVNDLQQGKEASGSGGPGKGRLVLGGAHKGGQGRWVGERGPTGSKAMGRGCPMGVEVTGGLIDNNTMPGMAAGKGGLYPVV